jgi:plasmid stabilization system protein ParE
MARKIKLSKRTTKKLDQLLEYLEKAWSLKVKKEFITKLDKSLRFIQENPESFQKSLVVKGLYKCVVTKQTTLYYRYDKECIYIVVLFDTRQNPKKLKKEAKN